MLVNCTFSYIFSSNSQYTTQFFHTFSLPYTVLGKFVIKLYSSVSSIQVNQRSHTMFISWYCFQTSSLFFIHSGTLQKSTLSREINSPGASAYSCLILTLATSLSAASRSALHRASSSSELTPSPAYKLHVLNVRAGKRSRGNCRMMLHNAIATYQ